MSEQGFNGERDLSNTRQTAGILVGGFVLLFVLAVML